VSLLTGRRGLFSVVLLLVAGALLLLAASSQAFGWVALAGVAGVVASSGMVRRMVGVVLVLVGAAAASMFLWSAAPEAVDELRWAWLGSVGGGLVALAGCLTIVFAHRWTGLSRKYDRSTAPSSSAPLDLWRALDRGEDPTEGSAPPSPNDVALGDER